MSRITGLYDREQDVELQHVANAKKAEIISQSDNAANAIKEQNTEHEAIAAKVGGGDYTAQRAQYESWLQSSALTKTMPPEVIAAKMLKWEQDVQRGVVVAGYENPDPVIRRQTIEQLTTGKGPLDLSKLDADEIGRLRTTALETDKKLTSLQEVQNFNGDIHHTKQVFDQPPFKNVDGTPNQAARNAAFEDDNWLIKNGYVTKDPSTGELIPDYVRAEDAKKYFMGEDRDANLAAKKKADDIRDQALTMMATGGLAKGMQFALQHIKELQAAGTDYFPQIISAYKGWTNEGIQQYNEGMRTQEFQWTKERHELEDRGAQTMLGFEDRIGKGEIIDYSEVISSATKKQMSWPQAAKIQEDIKHSTQDADYGNGLAIINGATALGVAKQTELQGKYRDAVRQQHLTGKQAIDKANELVKEGNDAHSTHLIRNLYNVLTGGVVIPPTTAPTTQVTPARPKGVPDNAVWNPATKTWQLPQ